MKKTFKSFYKKVLLWLMQTNFYRTVVLRIMPYIRFTMYYVHFDGWKYNQAYEILQPGDLILTVDPAKLTSKLIPGPVDHAVVCVSKDKMWETSDMVHDGYRKGCFFDICKESERIFILRLKDSTPEYIQKIIEKCKSFDGLEYDIEFKFGIKALYCSELYYMSDYENRAKADPEDIECIGREYISPTGYLMSEGMYVVYDSDSAIKPQF